jgi:hypothetical protein
MAVLFLQEFAVTDRSTANYDHVNEQLDLSGPPDGLIVHTAGFDDDSGVFRIVDVWETREQGERFMRERLDPIVNAMIADRPDAKPPTRESWYELHDILAG